MLSAVADPAVGRTFDPQPDGRTMMGDPLQLLNVPPMDVPFELAALERINADVQRHRDGEVLPFELGHGLRLAMEELLYYRAAAFKLDAWVTRLRTAVAHAAERLCEGCEKGAHDTRVPEGDTCRAQELRDALLGEEPRKSEPETERSEELPF
jgi:hypothetical protein